MRPQLYELRVKSWCINRQTAQAGYLEQRANVMVSEKIDNGNTLISDDMITWILDLPAEQGRCAGPGGQLNRSVIK